MWIVILIVVAIIFIIIVNNSGPIEKKKNNTVNKKVIEINLKEYPNEYSFNISGVHLQDYMYPVINFCKEFDLTELIPEPENKFDSNAIMVKASGWHIGYVPEEETYEVSQIMKKENISY